MGFKPSWLRRVPAIGEVLRPTETGVVPNGEIGRQRSAGNPSALAHTYRSPNHEERENLVIGSSECSQRRKIHVDPPRHHHSKAPTVRLSRDRLAFP